MNAEAAKSLTLWDCNGKADGLAVYWSQSDVSKGSFSIPLMVEEQSRDLRDEFICWSAGLSELPVGEGSLASLLTSDLLNGGSFWWMTIIADRSPMRSPQIYDILKLRVLENFYIRGDYTALRYVGNDNVLSEVLERWCTKLGYRYQWVKERSQSPAHDFKSYLKTVYYRLPFLLQGLAYLGYFISMRWIWATISSGRKTQFLPDGELAIVTYFPGIDLEAAKKGVFHSHYWGPLHGLLEELNIKVNWIWLYSRSPQMSYRESAKFKTSLNQENTRSCRERFALLEDCMDLRSLFKVVWAYLKRYWQARKITNSEQAFSFEGSQLNFYPVLKRDWESSLFGVDAMSTCLFAVAFRDMVKNLPKTTQKLLYLFENICWEQALLRAWCDRKLGPSIGVLHTPSITALMNFRIYAASSQERGENGNVKAVPDQVAVPGDVFRHRLIEYGWPKERLVSMEALRYFELWKAERVCRRLPSANRILLVVTGYMREESRLQLKLLVEAATHGALESYAKVVIKPHPDCPIDNIMQQLTPDFFYTIETASLSELWNNVNVAYTANSTSAVIEAVIEGLPIVITGTLESINLNPLLGVSGISFVNSSVQLAEQLANPTIVDASEKFFYLEQDMPRWRTYLGGS
ncbi:MAG: hypothetical protein GXP14_11125 [Gammaproteobacteria bacterium]|nr:hypothetical protein [Gammaproteobacteria bacterium]